MTNADNMKSGIYFENVTAIVLAGGKSVRMGTDKCGLPIGERTLIGHVLEQLKPLFGEILISSNYSQSYSATGLKVIRDREQGKGPLMGIISAMNESKNDINFVQACDIPQTNIDLMTKMLSIAPEFDVVMPQSSGNRLEPLFAVYKKTALKCMEHILEHEKGKPYLVADHCNAKLVKLGSSERLVNLNTIEDYTAFVKEHSSLIKQRSCAAE